MGSDEEATPHVLVAEDDVRQAEIIRRYLLSDGYRATIVHDGATALNRIRVERPDLVVLDVMMPGLDGLDVCRRLRQDSDIAVLMLTARSEEDDLIAALDVGADDYVTKPYSPRELMARVRTLLRRAANHRGAVASVRVGSLVIDEARHRATMHGEALELTPAEFAILAAMAHRPDGVFSRSQLLAHTQGVERGSTERSVDVHVMNLRRKIEVDPRRPKILETVYSVGYRLVDNAP